MFESQQGAYNANKWDGIFEESALPVGSDDFIIEFNNDADESEKGAVSIILNK